MRKLGGAVREDQVSKIGRWETVRLFYQGGMKIVDIVRGTGLSRSTVNRIIRSQYITE